MATTRRRDLLRLAGLGAWSLTGCARPTAGPSSSSASAPPTLTFWVGEVLSRKPLQDAYLAAAGVRLVPVQANPDTPSGVSTIDDGRQVDIIPLELIPWTGTLSELLPLEGLLRTGNFDATTVAADFLAAFRTGTHQWGMPFSAVPLVLYYDPVAFLGAGVPLPARAWTFDEFLQTCHLLDLHLQGRRAVLDGEGPSNTRVWAALVAAYRGAFTEADGGLASWSASVGKGLSAYAHLSAFTVGHARTTGVLQTPDTTAAMWFAPFHPGDWAAVGSGQVGIAAFPTVAGSPLTPFFPMGHGVGVGAPKPQATVAFLQWLLSSDGQRLVTGEGWPPVRREQQQSTAWFPVQVSETLDPAALVVPDGRRWWPPPALWSATVGPAADALGTVAPDMTEANMRGLWDGLRQAMAKWSQQSAFEQAIPNFYLDYRPLRYLRGNG